MAYLRQPTWIEYGPGPVAQPKRPHPRAVKIPIPSRRHARRGVGADCGSSPCTWVDEVWVRDECLSYLQQCSPNDPRVIAMQSGFLAGVTSAAADEVGAGLTTVGTNAGNVAGSTLSALATSLFQNPDGTTNWVTVGIAGALGFMVVQPLLGGLSGRRR